MPAAQIATRIAITANGVVMARDFNPAPMGFKSTSEVAD